MKLPNGHQAIIPRQKLTLYCLNPEHSSGKHKARVFKAILGITAQNVETLETLIQQAALEGAVAQQSQTPFGSQFKVDWPVPGYENVILRTLWEITEIQPQPRLISAFIK
ncbi:DUF6883 domain-containing protein [Prochlorothrix hollandica]|uniref:DUF6883 domain-containing protein n=1 Tax=Prochlorothrix hollandica PCC 9006 = CALU 1027 TaxID=317619 RepID=A0A0M2PV89_PROHO|nr:DUF6883 domain-containing protein [Prochlorothrix hollandica]KKI98296.1 hypothetical protein PROH_19130 [Prochlorothrix hollandica PCC 9006 = CALU 1027]